MASTVESTAASLADRRRQEGIDLCVTMMIQSMARDPWITVEEILDYITWIGPEGDVNRLMRLFGGREVFQRTVARMDIIRQAKIQGRLHELPITAERFNGTIPEIEENILLWAPRVAGGEPFFGFPPPGGNLPWEPLSRYPHEGTYSDDYLEEQGIESAASSVDPTQVWNSDEEGSEDIVLARSEAST